LPAYRPTRLTVCGRSVFGCRLHPRNEARATLPLVWFAAYASAPVSRDAKKGARARLWRCDQNLRICGARLTRCTARLPWTWLVRPCCLDTATNQALSFEIERAAVDSIKPSPSIQPHDRLPQLPARPNCFRKSPRPDLPERNLGSETLAARSCPLLLPSPRHTRRAARSDAMAAENYWRYADARQQQQAMVAAAAAAAGMAPAATVAAAQTVGSAAAAMNQQAAAAAMAQQAAAAPPLKRARPDFGGSCPPPLFLYGTITRSCFFCGYFPPPTPISSLPVLCGI
jgi:hypothetical protein